MANLTFRDPVFASYAFYAAILAVKLLMMSFVTAFYRMKTLSFANPEDTKLKGGKVKVNEDVERVRRAHLNDLENIPAFWTIGLLYVLTGPSTFMATLCFRLFGIARICHSIAYVVLKFTPLRGLCFMIGMLVNFFMALNVIMHLL